LVFLRIYRDKMNKQYCEFLPCRRHKRLSRLNQEKKERKQR